MRQNLENIVDFYSLLGLKRSASEVEIKQAYRKMAFRYHPDRNPGDKQAAEKFTEVLQAYGIYLTAASVIFMIERHARPVKKRRRKKNHKTSNLAITSIKDSVTRTTSKRRVSHDPKLNHNLNARNAPPSARITSSHVKAGPGDRAANNS